jgi:hypothetical protein
MEQNIHKKLLRADRVGQVVECLLSNHKSLSSNSRTAKKNPTLLSVSNNSLNQILNIINACVKTESHKMLSENLYPIQIILIIQCYATFTFLIF